MIRLAIGLGLLGAATYLGRQYSSGLSAPPRTYVARALDDVTAFAYTQFPREELRIDDDPRYSDSAHRVQCSELDPYLAAAVANLEEGLDSDEAGSPEMRVIIGQAWSAVTQPDQCATMKLPNWVLEET